MQQTDKFAGELKKELSKIQREREKLRAWLIEVRPEYHAQINAAKELVEGNMYKYRSFERAWKNRTGVFASGDVSPSLRRSCALCTAESGPLQSGQESARAQDSVQRPPAACSKSRCSQRTARS